MRTPYALIPGRSRGRLCPEAESTYRSCFQRDRDRIIHASAFRRLKHKTQVFVEHEGDHFRTRLTHSIEVAQVARTIAVALGLNPDLTEAVALAHDLGHPPFGHTGEEALQELMLPHGGFDHNAQALHIVTSLERHYAAFDGLNLTWESLEGIAKHNGPVTGALPHALASCNAHHDLELDSYASAEAQVAAIADDIAYNSHDLHDGIKAGLFQADELAKLPLLDGCFADIDRRYPGLEGHRRQYEALRHFFGLLVEDVIAETGRRLTELNPQDVGDIRAAGRAMVCFSAPLRRDLERIGDFLLRRMYRAPSVVKMRKRVAQIVRELFPAYMRAPENLPQEWQGDVANADSDTVLARIIADYIAGMTDRFALNEHARLIGQGLQSGQQDAKRQEGKEMSR